MIGRASQVRLPVTAEDVAIEYLLPEEWEDTAQDEFEEAAQLKRLQGWPFLQGD